VEDADRGNDRVLTRHVRLPSSESLFAVVSLLSIAAKGAFSCTAATGAPKIGGGSETLIVVHPVRSADHSKYQIGGVALFLL
jgi:hypothetical protein